MKKGRVMELIIFLCSLMLSGFTGWIYFEKSTEVGIKVDHIYDNMMTVEEASDIHDRLTKLEDKLNNPPTVNVVMNKPVEVQIPKPVKILTPIKPLPVQPSATPIPGNIPKLKSQIKKLSQ